MVATPFLPESPSQVLGRSQGFITGMNKSRLVFPGLAATARRHNDFCTPRVSRLIDAPRIVSAVTTETSRRLVRAELSEQPFDLGGVGEVIEAIGEDLRILLPDGGLARARGAYSVGQTVSFRMGGSVEGQAPALSLVDIEV